MNRWLPLSQVILNNKLTMMMMMMMMMLMMMTSYSRDTQKSTPIQ